MIQGKVDASGQQKHPFGGMRGGQMGGQMGGMGQDDMADLFSSLFGMNMGGMRGGMQRPPMRPQKGADIRYKMTLPFMEALKGGPKQLQKGLKLKFLPESRTAKSSVCAARANPGLMAARRVMRSSKLPSSRINISRGTVKRCGLTCRFP